MNKKLLYLLIVTICILLCASAVSATENVTHTKEQKTLNKEQTTSATDTVTEQTQIKKEKNNINPRNVKSGQKSIKLDMPTKTTSDTTITIKARARKNGEIATGGKIKIMANWVTIFEKDMQYGIGATFYRTPVKAGTYPVIAQYLVNGQVVAQDKQSITTSAPVTTLDLPTQSSTDNKIKIVARVKNNNQPVTSGKLKITANWNTIYENPNINQGVGAVYYTTPTKAGTYTITAQYLKNGQLISQTKQNIRVINTESLKYYVDGPGSGPIYPYQTVLLYASVTKPSGTVNNGYVRFSVGGKEVGTKAVKNGVASMQYSAGAPNSRITTTAEYIKGGVKVASDSGILQPSYQYYTDIEPPSTIKKGNTLTIKAFVEDELNEYLNKGKVSFSIDNEWIGTVSVKENIATLKYNVNKNPGTYALKATYIDSRNNVASETDVQYFKVEKSDNTLQTTLYYDDNEKQVGTDRLEFDYFERDEQFGKGVYVFLYTNGYYDDVIPSTYRLLSIKVYYVSEYEDIITRTATATYAGDYSVLSTPVIYGYEPYKVDISYRKMTASEKKANKEYSIL